MATSSSALAAHNAFPKLYRKLVKDLRKEFIKRDVFRSREGLLEDVVEIVWHLVGHNLIDLNDKHSFRGMWSWREECNIALAITHCVIEHMRIESYTQYDIDTDLMYFCHC